MTIALTAVYQDMPVQKGEKVLEFRCGNYLCTLSWKDGELIFQRGYGDLNDATVLSLRFSGKPTAHTVAESVWWGCHGRSPNALELANVSKIVRTFVESRPTQTIQEWIAYQRQLANEYPVESNRDKWRRIGEENMLSLLESFLAEQK